MKQVNVKKLILPNIPYVFIALLATKVSEAVRLAPGSDASAKLLNIMTGLNTAFHSLVPSFHPIDLCMGVAAAIAIRLAVYIKGKNAKKFRKNLEYGSARWGTAEDIKPYVDPAFENNIILTQTERLTMNSRPKDPKTARNKNVLIVGGSGSGKTRFWLKPNLLQCTSKTYPTSFVVTDPKGDIVVSCGHALQKNGYQIKILNSLNFKKSMHYNPFAYIHSEKDILKLVTTLIANTKGEGKAGDDFWVKAETLLYTALIGYIHYEAPVEEQNFSTLIEFINAMEVREDDEDFKNPVDLMFEELKKRMASLAEGLAAQTAEAEAAEASLSGANAAVEAAAEALHKKDVELATQKEKLDIILNYVDEAQEELKETELERAQIRDNIENIDEQRRAAETDREGLEEGNFATQEDIKKTQEALAALRAEHAAETERATERRVALMALEKEGSAAENERARMRRELAQVGAAIEADRRAAEEALAKFGEMRNALSAIDGTIDAERREVDAHTDRLHAMENERAKHLNALDELRARREAVSAELGDMRERSHKAELNQDRRCAANHAGSHLGGI